MRELLAAGGAPYDFTGRTDVRVGAALTGVTAGAEGGYGTATSLYDGGTR
ncbi:hypothetical protein ACFYY3_18110 [Streptomyces sp. NPDC001812]|uniref:Uncharacterized protein n=1 Tax=Streptomyces cathayae TaxID=3031124 RepID=A0ABY8K0P4_9ACTN|nr:hypothetical protein [Streptomyces sp. HUAS 5]WGD41442.1 hypothetical protein PYS65_15410 [Streptomyces sp. HUAS 5]